MLPVILSAIGGALAGGVGSMLGGLGSAYIGKESQKDTNKANIALGREQMDFQERMSNTAYQRAMDDMSEAGLNPILAYQQGGASSPGGAMPQIQSPVIAGLNVGASVMNSASNVATQASQRDKLRQEVDNLGEQLNLTVEQRWKTYQEIDKVMAEIDNIRANTEGVEADNVQRQILADFYNSANFARIAKDIGINPSTLKAIFVGIFGGKKK